MDLEYTRTNTPNKKKNRGKPLEKASGKKNDINLLTIKTKEIADQLKSIDHFLYLYTVEGKFFLPPKYLISWEYVKKILTGEKKLLKQSQIEVFINLPKARGFNIINIFREMEDDEEFNRYFPDLKKSSSIPREYFLTVGLKDTQGP